MKLGTVIFFLIVIAGNLSEAIAGSKKILFVSAAHSNKAKVTLIKTLVKDQSLHIAHQSEKTLGDLDKATAVFESYDLVILDAVSKNASKKYFNKYAPLIKSSATRFLAIKSPENTAFLRNIDPEQAKKLFDYYSNGGVENLSRMLQYLRQVIFNNGPQTVAGPIIYPLSGIYHPDYDRLIFDSLSSYRLWKNNHLTETPAAPSDKTINKKPAIGLLIARASIESAQTAIIDAAIKKLEQKGADVLAVFYESRANPNAYKTLLQVSGETVVDTFINFRIIHFANQRKLEFEALSRPVIQALTYFDGNQQQWEKSTQGISAGMMAFTLVLPETAGIIDPIVVAAIDAETGKAQPIDYQLDYLIDKTLRYAALSKKANADKKITVMFWGDKDMGASFLNVPDSLHTISHRLNNEGYTIKPYEHDYYSDRADRILNPFYRDYELEQLLADDLADLLPVSAYQVWLDTLPANVVQTITDFWGKPKDNFMVVKRNSEYFFVIPRIRNGNMLIMRQPPRGDNKDQDQTLYHTGTVPMNHYYLAAYYYARAHWGSDAFIHLGTHGSQEYLPGKERGLSRFDGGSLSIGTVPVMYPFIVDDVGEAMQTKRRGGAVVLSHMTPPYAAAGLQGVTADIHELMHQYNALDDGGVKEKTAAQIVQLCIEHSLCKDFGWTKPDIDANFEQFLVALHDYMAELAAQNQPLGLHSFGELAEGNLLISTIVQMLGTAFIGQASQYEAQYYSKTHQHKDGLKHRHQQRGEHEHSHYNAKQPTSHSEQHGNHFHESATDLQALAGFKTVRDFVVGTADIKQLTPSLQAFIQTGRQYYNNMQNIKELDNLVIGLAGGYVPVKTGGDPIRHPDSLPTGLNLYGFDPARLPTKAAYLQGEELIEDLLANYYKDNGHYPTKIAFSLWSIEAMRHYGVLESQALKAMGVKPVWSNDGRVVDTHIIPASELKRPRVDIVLSATGLYRDAFPNVMQRLAAAIKQVAELKEDNNSLWTNSQRIKADMIAQGTSFDEAAYLSTVRIFSSASGQYGSGVDGPVFNSDTWETDAKIADNYLAKMGYYFGADNTRWGQQVKGLYAKQLSGTQIVAFSRSSNLYGMITSDDPFEYFGSLAMAVRNLDGKSPQMIISNLRDASRGKMENAAAFLAKELRTRNFSKRWVQEMQKEGYSGAVTMAANVANFWGWQVVDPNLVRADQWKEFFDVYVNDKLNLDINQWFEQVNPGAQVQLIERMLEAVRKDYWNADTATLQAMIQRYQQLITQYNLIVDNEKLRDYVNQQMVGFGLDMQLPAPVTAAAQAANSEQVEGQQLEKVEPDQIDSDYDKTLLLMIVVCLLILASGAWWQANYKKAP